MSEGTQFQKMIPAKRCRLIDIEECEFLDEEREILTIFGKIKRLRIFGNLIVKKSNKKDEEEESMIMNQEGEKNQQSFLIDDGTAKMWFTTWGDSEEKYKNLNPGDLVQVVGYVSKKVNDKIFINVDFISKVNNPNFEIIHDLELIKAIKKGGKQVFNKNVEKDELYIEEDDVDNLIKGQMNNEDENMIADDDFDDLDEFDYGDIDFDEEELEEEILKIISNEDRGDGVTKEKIVSKINVSEDKILESIKKLKINTKIYSVEDNTYKIYTD